MFSPLMFKFSSQILPVAHTKVQDDEVKNGPAIFLLFVQVITLIPTTYLCIDAGAEGECSTVAGYKDRCLLDDVPHRDGCLGCSYQVLITSL